MTPGLSLLCPACQQPVVITDAADHDCPIAADNERLRARNQRLLTVLTEALAMLQIGDLKNAFRIIREVLEAD